MRTFEFAKKWNVCCQGYQGYQGFLEGHQGYLEGLLGLLGLPLYIARASGLISFLVPKVPQQQQIQKQVGEKYGYKSSTCTGFRRGVGNRQVRIRGLFRGALGHVRGHNRFNAKDSGSLLVSINTEVCFSPLETLLIKSVRSKNWHDISYRPYNTCSCIHCNIQKIKVWS